MARPSGALQQARHPFGRADLQHALDWQKVHTQVKTGRTHHRPQLAVFKPGFYPFAHAPVQRAVVQGNHARPVRPRLQQCLVPDFGLRAGVGEDQRGAAARNLVNDLRQHAQAQMPAPGKTTDLGGQQRINDEFFGGLALYKRARRMGVAQQRVHRFIEIAQRGRHAPGEQLRVPLPQSCQNQLGLHAAFVAQQLMPFVHHHHLHTAQRLAGVGA